MSTRWVFRGHIAGVGTTSGTRIVVGRWHTSPWGPFADVMVERPDGHRILLAPDDRVAEFVAATYTFDEVRIEHVGVSGTTEGRDDPRWTVRTTSLELDLEVGGRTTLGRLLRLVPGPVARAPWWTRVTNVVAPRVVPGVQTRGAAGDGSRSEFYGATDHREVVAAHGRWEGVPMGDLTPVEPPPQFGFSSTTAQPSVTTVATTVLARETAPRR